LADIGVVYLCRFAEGELPIRVFLNTYRARPAGIDHDLHVIFKGFPDQRSVASARTLFASLPMNPIELDDTGFDIGSYFATARRVSNRRLIFFNTFSELLADDWLKKFDVALSLPGVGLVGATGSWQSLSSYYEVLISRVWHEGGHVFDYLTGRSTGVRRTQEISGAESGEAAAEDLEFNERTDAARAARGLYRLLRLDRYFLYLYEFGRYPNPHVRSNAFMIERDRFLSLHTLPFNNKRDVYKIESGRRSITRQILARGLKPIVVDRLGKVYDISDWKSSSTFWVDEQSNLIVADNRTRDYAKAGQARRAFLEDNAWAHPSSWKIAQRRAGFRSQRGHRLDPEKIRSCDKTHNLPLS
jgi:hypothetical protein